MSAFLLEIMARMILSGCLGMQWNILIIIPHTLNRPFFMGCYSWTINWSVKLVHGPLAAGQLTGQLNLFTVRLHHNTIKGSSLNE